MIDRRSCVIIERMKLRIGSDDTGVWGSGFFMRTESE